MGFLDRLLGRDDESKPDASGGAGNGVGAARKSDDEIAVERYRYLLRTAPPEMVEQVHTEAFGKLTTEQRALVFTELSRHASAGDAPVDESPAALARSATRSELRQPGLLEKAFAGTAATSTGRAGAVGGSARGMAGGGLGGVGLGSMFASSLLGSVAGFVIGSAIAQAFIPDDIGTDQAADAGADGSADPGSDAGDGGSDASDPGVADDRGSADGGDFAGGAGSDSGGDFGSDFGGDFGF